MLLLDHSNPQTFNIEREFGKRITKGIIQNRMKVYKDSKKTLINLISGAKRENR